MYSGGIIILSHLYGNALDLSEFIEDEVLEAADGSELIVDEVYKRDRLSVVALASKENRILLNNK